VNTDPDYIRPVYGVANASIGAEIDEYTMSVYAKNLFDDSKEIQHPSILFNPQAYTVRPRTVGVTLKAKF
jgi:outer membrane receptor protein involved in Fe transport